MCVLFKIKLCSFVVAPLQRDAAQQELTAPNMEARGSVASLASKTSLASVANKQSTHRWQRQQRTGSFKIQTKCKAFHHF